MIHTFDKFAHFPEDCKKYIDHSSYSIPGVHALIVYTYSKQNKVIKMEEK